MPNSNYNLEEQLRQDRRMGNAKLRKRRLRRSFPFLLLLLLLLAAALLFFSSKENEAETKLNTEPAASGTSVATLN